MLSLTLVCHVIGDPTGLFLFRNLCEIILFQLLLFSFNRSKYLLLALSADFLNFEKLLFQIFNGTIWIHRFLSFWLPVAALFIQKWITLLDQSPLRLFRVMRWFRVSGGRVVVFPWLLEIRHYVNKRNLSIFIIIERKLGFIIDIMGVCLTEH